ncbi:Uncharacterised protein [Enterobacter hormaechei]|nr:Uncharacterised protein [Enterobacter hormaechei]
MGERQSDHRLCRASAGNTDAAIDQGGARQFAKGVTIVSVILLGLRIARAGHHRSANGITDQIAVTGIKMNGTRTGARGGARRQRLQQFIAGFFGVAGKVGKALRLQRRKGRECLKHGGNGIHALRVRRLHLLLQLLGQRGDIDVCHLRRGLLWCWRVKVCLYRSR